MRVPRPWPSDHSPWQRRSLLLALPALALVAGAAGPATTPVLQHPDPATTQPAGATTTAPPPAPLPPPPPTAAPPVPAPAPVAPVPASQPVVTAPPAVAPPPAPKPPPPVDERVAYGMGYAAGRRIRERVQAEGQTVDAAGVVNGLLDGLAEKDPRYPRAEVQAAFNQAEAAHLQRLAERRYADDPAFRLKADDNLQRSRDVMTRNAQQAGVQVLPDGVQVQVLRAAEGRVVANAKELTVNLRVTLADGTLVRASPPGKPVQLATADALPSLVDAIRGMKVGETWRLVLPPEKAFGLAGKDAVIGPNEAVAFEIELLGLQ